MVEGREGRVSDDKRVFLKARPAATPGSGSDGGGFKDGANLEAVVRTLRPSTLIGAASVSDLWPPRTLMQ